MDIKVIKEYKNGSKIVEVSRTVTTRFKVIDGKDDGLEADGNTFKTVNDPIYNGRYMSDAVWEKIEELYK